MKKILPLLFVITLLLQPFVAMSSTQVTLEWSANTEPNLAGYKVFVREEGQVYDYANPVWEIIETTCTIYDLDEAKTYFFVVRAFDTEEFESGNSNEVTLEPSSIIDDVVEITSVYYSEKKDTLSIKATSSEAGLVVLTVWVSYNDVTIELGDLKYSSRKGYYSTFRKVSRQPDSVTVTSTGGGRADY